MGKFADDTYLIVPAANVQACANEIAQVESWAAENNLTLNRIKSVEIVFVSPWSKRGVGIPPPAVPGFARAESIKALGVTISRRFSVTGHVDNLLVSCAQTLFALQTLQHNGLQTNALQAIFQVTVVAKLSYASPAWYRRTPMQKTRSDWRRSSVVLQSSDIVRYLLSPSQASAPRLTTNCSWM